MKHVLRAWSMQHWMESCNPSELLANPYFFCENGKEFSWLEIAQEIGKGLHSAGKIKSPEPRSIPKDLWEEPIVGLHEPGILCDNPLT